MSKNNRIGSFAYNVHNVGDLKSDRPVRHRREGVAPFDGVSRDPAVV